MSAHVVEMAHLLGVDMTKRIANSEAYEEKKIHLEVMGDDLKFGIENNPDGRMFDFLAKRGIDGKVVFKQDSTETPQLTIVDVNYPKLYESADVPRDEIYLRYRDNPEKITFRDEDGDRYVHVFPTWLNRETCWATPHAAGTKKGLLSSQCGEMTPPQLGEFADQQRALSLPPKDIRYVLIDANVPASALE